MTTDTVKVLGGSPYQTDVDESMANVLMVPIGFIEPAADNPRREVGDVKELAESIRAQGILQPLVVCYQDPRATGGAQYKLVIGHRRFAAAQAAGLTRVPVLVRRFSEQERIEAMMVENLQRSDLAPIEEASAFKTLSDMGLSQRAIAERIGRSQAHISRRLALLDLPVEAVEALDTGRITIEDAVALTKLSDMPKRQAAALKSAQVNRWQSIPEAVAAQLEDHRRAEARGKALQQLKAAGVKVVEEGPQYGGKPRWLTGQEQRVWGYTVELEVSAHAGEPCHRAHIDQEGGIRYLCSDPSRHAAKGASDLKVPKEASSSDPAAAAKARKEQREQAELAKRRVEFLSQQLNGPVVIEDLFARAVPAMLGAVWAQVLKKACVLLGTTVATDQETNRQTLGAHARHHPAETLLAVAVAQSEEWIGPWPSAKEKTRDYFNWLQGRGYELSPLELKLAGLDEKPATPLEVNNLSADDPLAPIADWDDDVQEEEEVAG